MAEVQRTGLFLLHNAVRHVRLYLSAIALRLARGPVGRFLLSWILTYMSFAVPARRLRETSTLLAFFHPQPSYPFHVLLVPKRQLAGLEDLTPGDSVFMSDLFAAVQSLVAEHRLEQTGYRLIANGGAYQDAPHLHFHLVADTLPTAVDQTKDIERD